MLIGLKKRKQTVKTQLQKSDDKEKITVDIIEATNSVDQTKKTNNRKSENAKLCKAMKKPETENNHEVKTKQKQPKRKHIVQSRLGKRNNKENTAVNVIEATNFVDQTKKTKEKDEKQCIGMSKSKTETHRELKTEHSRRFKSTINHMPGTDHKKRVRCKFEGCDLASSYYCIECGVHLCIKSDPENTQEKNCFLKYHTLPE